MEQIGAPAAEVARVIPDDIGPGRPEPLSRPEDCLLQMPPHWYDCKPEEKEIFDRLWHDYLEASLEVGNIQHSVPHDPMRLVQFMNLMRVANSAPPGEYGEFGSHRGLMTRVIHKLMSPDQVLYSFDTFEGFKKPDLQKEEEIYSHSWVEGNFTPTSPEIVAYYVGDGCWPENFRPIKGWFPESFRGYEGVRWRFVHIDFDLYQPIKHALELLWPRLVPGGVCVVHDYGCLGFPGVKKAVDEFFDGIGLTPINLGDRWGSVAVVKPKPPGSAADWPSCEREHAQAAELRNLVAALEAEQQQQRSAIETMVRGQVAIATEGLLARDAARKQEIAALRQAHEEAMRAQGDSIQACDATLRAQAATLQSLEGSQGRQADRLRAVAEALSAAEASRQSENAALREIVREQQEGLREQVAALDSRLENALPRLDLSVGALQAQVEERLRLLSEDLNVISAGADRLRADLAELQERVQAACVFGWEELQALRRWAGSGVVNRLLRRPAGAAHSVPPQNGGEAK